MKVMRRCLTTDTHYKPISFQTLTPTLFFCKNRP